MPELHQSTFQPSNFFIFPNHSQCGFQCVPFANNLRLWPKKRPQNRLQIRGTFKALLSKLPKAGVFHGRVARSSLKSFQDILQILMDAVKLVGFATSTQGCLIDSAEIRRHSRAEIDELNDIRGQTEGCDCLGHPHHILRIEEKECG